jgi:ABC-type branched-subunit amino acid transport system substrate-binding protein
LVRKWAPRALPLFVTVLLAVIAVGCGEGGAASGATVRVYVSAPLRGPEAGVGREICQGARAGAARSGGAVGDLELEVVCLDAAGKTGRWTLAKVGSNARRATEDSTAVAYVGEPDPRARKQSRPIVAAAEIAAIGGVSGEEAVERVVAAIDEGNESEPRAAVFKAEG